MTSPSPASLRQIIKRGIRVWIVIGILLALLAARVFLFALGAPQGVARPLAPADLHRQGHLALAQGGHGVAMLDLASGAFTRLFKPPANSLVTGVAISPDGKTVVMAYAPPPTNTLIQFGYTDLYIMPADGSAPPSLLAEAPGDEVYYQPAWSPDGAFIYYAHLKTAAGAPGLTVERMAFPNGATSVIAKDGSGPALFPDGSRLAYIHRDARDYTESLYGAGADGAGPAPLLDPKTFQSLDAVRVAPDGRSVIFSAAGAGSFTEAPSDPLAGAVFGQTASAHGIPSDLWRMALDGSRPTRLTHLEATGVVPSFGSQTNEVYFVANGNLYLLDVSAGQLYQIQIEGTSFFVAWGS